MPVQYEPQIDDADDVEELTRTEILFEQITSRGRHWPYIMGVVQIIVGMVVTILGVTEVFLLPLIDSEDGNHLVFFNKKTCYGCGMFAGILMTLTGSTFLRASLSKRNTTIYRFFHLTILTLLLSAALTVFLIVAYAKGWTTRDQYPPSSNLPEVHFFVTIFTVLGLVFAVSCFAQYFDVICFGDYPLWKPWLMCCAIACCCCRMRRRMSFDSAMREDFNTRCNPI